MRKPRDKTRENRERIVAAAARLFRERGFDGTGVDAIMDEVGLTHGGFYRYFRSKEELASEAVAHGLAGSATRLAGTTSVAALVERYLSPDHCADRGGGCAVAALGGELVRQAPAARGAFAVHVNEQIDRLARLMAGDAPPADRTRAIAVYAGLVGALTLARAVDDPALADEILRGARTVFGADLPAAPSAA